MSASSAFAGLMPVVKKRLIILSGWSFVLPSNTIYADKIIFQRKSITFSRNYHLSEWTEGSRRLFSKRVQVLSALPSHIIADFPASGPSCELDETKRALCMFPLCYALTTCKLAIWIRSVERIYDLPPGIPKSGSLPELRRGFGPGLQQRIRHVQQPTESTASFSSALIRFVSKREEYGLWCDLEKARMEWKVVLCILILSGACASLKGIGSRGRRRLSILQRDGRSIVDFLHCCSRIKLKWKYFYWQFWCCHFLLSGT